MTLSRTLVSRFVLISALLLLSACDDDGGSSSTSTNDAGGDAATDGGTTSATQPDGPFINQTSVDTASNQTPVSASDQTLNLLEQAQLGAVSPNFTNSTNLAAMRTGQLWMQELDIDGDSEPEALTLFLDADTQITFLMWSEGGLCHLAWDAGATAWLLFAQCGAQETVVCNVAQTDPERACQECGAATCDPCYANANGVYCGPEESWPINEEVGEDMGAVGDVSDNEDVVVPLDTGVTDVSPPDGPVWTCDSECTSQSGSVCCTGCGCDASLSCEPNNCAEPTWWDCESRCCFDSEAFMCTCPDGSAYDQEQFCCAIPDGGPCLQGF